MVEDERCCGTGTCLINADGQCWCGQRWDGQKMCFAERSDPLTDIASPGATTEPHQLGQTDQTGQPD